MDAGKRRGIRLVVVLPMVMIALEVDEISGIWVGHDGLVSCFGLLSWGVRGKSAGDAVVRRRIWAIQGWFTCGGFGRGYPWLQRNRLW